MASEEPEITFRKFLENSPPGSISLISDLTGNMHSDGRGTQYAYLSLPELSLHCGHESCRGVRFFQATGDQSLSPNVVANVFVTYTCKNCSSQKKLYALTVRLTKGGGKSGVAFKIGEEPAFGSPLAAKLISLIGPDRELFIKGRRAENQGLGIGAFAYYRRVIENQKDRIFDEIIRVCKRLKADPSTISDLELAKQETQFSKAVESVKHGLPQALLVNGHNPLSLLHSALSEGLHAQTDETCLELATSIRLVLGDFTERVSQVLKDEAELNSAISRLLSRKSAKDAKE